MMEAHRVLAPGGLFGQFVDDEGFDQRATGRGHGSGQGLGRDTEQRGGKTGVGEVQLGVFDDPGGQVSGPYRQPVDEEDGFEKFQVSTDRSPMQAGLVCGVGRIVFLGGDRGDVGQQGS